MAKDSPRSGPKTAARTRSRRGGAVRDRGWLLPDLGRYIHTPGFGWAITISAAFILVCGALASWTREQPLVAIGRVMNDTAVVRVRLQLQDRQETERQRELEKQKTPRVYQADLRVLETTAASIENLPTTLAGAEQLSQVSPEVRAQFRLTQEALAAVRNEIVEGQVSRDWSAKSRQLFDRLKRTPIVDDATWQKETQEGLNTRVELRTADASIELARDTLISIKDEAKLREAMERIAREAGFTEPVLSAVVSRLTTAAQPTYAFDPASTVERQNAAAYRIPAVVRDVPVGHVIFKRGDQLDEAQLDVYTAELKEFRERSEQRWRLWVRRLSVLAGVTAITAAAAGYLGLFAPRIRRNPGRMAGLGALMAGTLAVASFGSIGNPDWLMLTAVAPTVFVAFVLVIAYDQRIALALGSLHGVLVCIALDQKIGVYALILTGIGVAIWQLKEIRDRRSLIRTAVYTAFALAIGTVLVALIDRPITPLAIEQTIYDAGRASFGGLLVGAMTLFILPAVERLFDTTTGMTLIELRDPKNPLLRQLQQRAPGTYNHSLNVASIAEAAADAVEANALLTYVGALYHDIGKMNKPDYFVENQTSGLNKHDKLSPAMSLLVIVGHVKDGLALAREFDLPKTILHFIEAHHGTTLVEFFYNRARRQAEETAAAAGAEDAELPEEIEYRYPGPKPQTKEVAILMLADAVESATRTMAEPTPSRIDALVRAIANKRLMDGQFDECELTLRELQTITESISKSVASIYHGRVLYPSTSSFSGSPPGAKSERRA